MGKIGKGKSPISSQIDERQKAYIGYRAAHLKWTPSKFTAEIIDEWFRRGSPPLAPGDDTAIPFTQYGGFPSEEDEVARILARPVNQPQSHGSEVPRVL